MIIAGELVKELGARLGISLALNENGLCSVNFDKDTVDFELSGNDLYLIAELGLVQAGADKEFYKQLLEANFLGTKTAGAAISLDPDKENMVVLHKKIVTPMEYTDFEKAVEFFVKAVRYWKEYIALPRVQNKEVPLTEYLHTMIRI